MLRVQAKSTKQRDKRNGRNENHSFSESKKWSTNASVKVMLVTLGPNQRVISFGLVAWWHGLWSSYVFVSWYSISILGYATVGCWSALSSAGSARWCSLAFSRHPPGLVHPGGPTRRFQDKGGPFGVGDSSTFETLLWEVAKGHWAEKMWWRSCKQENLVFFFGASLQMRLFEVAVY